MIKLQHLNRAILMYLYLPIAIFIVGWLRWYVAIPVLLLTAIGILKGGRRLKIGHEDKKLSLNIMHICLYFLFFIGFLIFLGHGDLFRQDYDWDKHHAIYYDLMNYDWPVQYKGDVMLTYYIGQYIVPAAIAKLFFCSHTVLNVAIVLWNATGLLLAFLFIVTWFNLSQKKTFLVLFVLIAWGGITNVGNTVYWLYKSIQTNQPLFSIIDLAGIFSKWMDMYSVRIHFASNYNTIYGAFQHIIVPWLSGCLFFANRNKRECYMLIGLPLLFSSTFGFVYFCVILFAVAIVDLVRDYSNRTKWFRSIFSVSNLCLLPIFAVMAIYFLGRFSADAPPEMGLTFLLPWDHLVFYIVFVLCEFLCYAICLYPKYKKDSLFYIIVIELLLIPIPALGVYNDLCSRGAIPARFILMLFCIEQLISCDWKNKKQRIISGVMVLFILISGSRALYQAGESIYIYNNLPRFVIYDNYGSLEGYAGNPEERIDNAYNYYTFDYQNSLFYNIAKK